MFKPCKEHQYRDPVTNRCKNKPDYKRDRSKSVDKPDVVTYKPCKDHQYRDPVTNRCKNKPDYKRDRSPRNGPPVVPHNLKPCKDHQYRDPVTHRCRNKPKEKTIPVGPVRSTPPSRWKQAKKVIGDCIKRSKLPLRELQVKVVQYMQDHDSLLVMHGTGTGKTLTAITTSQCYLDGNPGHKVVFVGPASLISNFQKELVRYGLDDTTDYLFYSFDKFYKDIKRINLTNTMLIVDEVHNLRNPKSKKSQAVVNASFKADKRLLLSATPFVNNMMDFIPLINMLYGRHIVGTRMEFANGEVQEWLGKKATDENLATLRYLMRDKIDVVTLNKDANFPERIEHIRKVPMTNEYYKRYIRILSGEDIYDILFTDPEVFYNGYRRAVNKAGPLYYSMKIENTLPILNKGKSIVYTNWIEFGIKPITEALKINKISYRIFTGEVDVKDRQTIIDDFNNDKFQVLVITKAGGEGLDLRGVRSVVVMDPTWNDASLQQIIGRAIRYKSHTHLPLNQQKVDVYFMALTKPVGVGTPGAVASGDILLYGIIEKKKELNAAIIAILEDMSL